MFTFSLQSVLDVRERMEKLKYKEYSQVLQERRRLEGEVDRRETALVAAARNNDAQRREGRSALPLQLFENYRRRLRSEIDRVREQMRQQEQELEARRMELVEARRAHRTLEILKEKERKRYDQEQARRERAFMDEVASNYHVFRQ